jgi:hypothetical protein
MNRFYAKLRHQLYGGGGSRLRNQANHFRLTYAASLSAQDRDILETFADRPGICGRLGAAIDRRVWRQFPVDDMALRALIATGRL